MTLLPCPHCGGTNLKIGNLKPFKAQMYLSCYGCLAQVVGCNSEEQAIAAWNRRADQDTLNKAVKLIDELLEKEPLYALGEWPSLRDALSILTNKGASHE